MEVVADNVDMEDTAGEPVAQASHGQALRSLMNFFDHNPWEAASGDHMVAEHDQGPCEPISAVEESAVEDHWSAWEQEREHSGHMVQVAVDDVLAEQPHSLAYEYLVLGSVVSAGLSVELQ